MTVKKKIESYIEAGSQVKSDKKRIYKRQVLVYIPEDFLSSVDDHIKKRIGLSRNAWIVEAIQEKMEKENG